MAGVRISELPSGGSAQTTDLIPIARANSTFSIQASNLITGAGTSLKGRSQTSPGDVSDIIFNTNSLIVRNSGSLENILASTNTILSRESNNIAFTKINNNFFNDNTISNSKLANMVANSIKVNNTSAAATPTDLNIPEYSIIVRNNANITTISAGQNTVLTRDGSGNIDFRSFSSAYLAKNSVALDRLVTISADRVLGRSANNGDVVETQIVTNMISNGAVTVGKIQNIAANTILSNNTSFIGPVVASTSAQLKLVTSNSGVESSTTGITEIRNMVAITQSDYNSLTTKKSDTYYIII